MLDCDAGHFEIYIPRCDCTVSVEKLEGKVLRPFVGIYYGNSTVSVVWINNIYNYFDLDFYWEN